jgi:hypothetical protein
MNLVVEKPDHEIASEGGRVNKELDRDVDQSQWTR